MRVDVNELGMCPSPQFLNLIGNGEPMLYQPRMIFLTPFGDIYERSFR